MRSFITALVLLFGAAGAAAAQGTELPLGFHPTVGVFSPMNPVVVVANGVDPSVRLEAAPAVGVELDYRFHPIVGGYLGVTGAFSQLVHSSIMELQGPNPPNSRTNIVISTIGMLITPPIPVPMGVQPMLRLGFGSKWYDFDLPELESDNVWDFAADVGLGLSGDAGRLSFTTEARWVPSRFDPDYLPIRFGTDDPAQQWQNDWVFQIGFRYLPLPAAP